MVRKGIGAALALAAVAGLAGCASIGAQKAVKKDQAHVNAGLHSMDKGQADKTPWLKDSPGFYIGAKTLKGSEAHRLPVFFDKKVQVVETDSLILPDAISRLATVLNVPIKMGPELAKKYSHMQSSGHQLSIRLDYSGTVKGLLNTVTGYFGIAWKWHPDEGTISFQKYETQTFSLSLLPNPVGTKSDISNSSSMGGGGGGKSGGSSSSGGEDVTSKYTADPWKSIESNVKSMLSKGGQESVDPSLGTVTVTDMPEVIRRVKSYISGVSESADRQAQLTVRVYSIKLKRSAAAGFSLDAVFHDLAKRYGVNLSSASPAQSLNGAGSLSVGILPSAPGALGQWGGTQALVKALNNYGATSVVNSSSAIAMQGVPTPVQVNSTLRYIAQQQTTSTANVGTQTSVQIGQLTTGFSMTVTPRILHRSVILQYVLDISTLNQIQTVNKKGLYVQLPQTSARKFLQRAKLGFGQTLVLSGFIQKSNDNSNTSGLLSHFNQQDRNRNLILVTIHVERA